MHSPGPGLPDIALYVSPDEDKPKVATPMAAASTWSPSEMAAFSQGSSSWVPHVSDPTEPAAIAEPVRHAEDSSIKRIKLMAIGGSAFLVLLAAAIVFAVLHPSSSPSPASTTSPSATSVKTTAVKTTAVTTAAVKTTAVKTTAAPTTETDAADSTAVSTPPPAKKPKIVQAATAIVSTTEPSTTSTTEP
jgi:hypothetical protein